MLIFAACATSTGGARGAERAAQSRKTGFSGSACSISKYVSLCDMVPVLPARYDRPVFGQH